MEVRFQAFPDSCYRCRKTGHFAKDCPGPDPPQADSHQEPQPTNPENSQAPTKELVLVEKGKKPMHKEVPKPNPEPSTSQHKEEGWKEVQKKGSFNPAKTPKAKPLQTSTNKIHEKKSIKKDARGKGKPLATMLEDKENMFSCTVNLSDD